ncbi:MAG TPA: response regulator transcription factor [Chthonomonadaceae bacterium]|nr:response regulator transcription factor [Chthonomonadaceae bacterium]
MRILLIEDEVAIASVVKRGLEQARYQVAIAQDGARGLEMALTGNYSLILLDLMLPKLDGWQVCEELRAQRCSTPILMLTARGQLPDRVRGLEMGADDYLPKPFEFIELLARVRALLRRDKVHKAKVFRVADLEIDTSLHRVTRAGREIALSPREYTLLEALAAHEGHVLSREAIQDRVWMDEEAYSNTVDVYIGMLRKKIDADSATKLIHTVRGAGYTLRRPESGEARQ